jgi:hypothetical protein
MQHFSSHATQRPCPKEQPATLQVDIKVLEEYAASILSLKETGMSM